MEFILLYCARLNVVLDYDSSGTEILPSFAHSFSMTCVQVLKGATTVVDLGVINHEPILFEYGTCDGLKLVPQIQPILGGVGWHGG